MRSLRLPALALALLAPLGCFTVDDDGDGGSSTKDGGIVDLSRDSGPDPQPDAGPAGNDAGPPPQDAGPPPGTDAGPPQLTIESFTADQTNLAFLTTTLLRYSVSEASSCEITPDIGDVTPPAGTQVVSAGQPGDSTTYTLTCEGNGGPKSASVTITTTLVNAGSTTVTSGAGLAGLTGVNVVTGNLVIQNADDVSTLEDALATLVRVDGDLIVRGNDALGSVRVPNLAEVGNGLILFDNDPLASLELPALSRIGERLFISRNLELPQAEIDALVTQVEDAEGIGGPIVDYYNDPATVLVGLDQIFTCVPTASSPFGGGLQRLDLLPNGNANLYTSNDVYAGGYARSGNHLTFSFGAHSETTSETEIEFDRVTALRSASFELCAMMGTPGAGLAAETTYTCNELETNDGQERNSVTVGIEGAASWSFTRVDPDLPGGQSTETVAGAYVVDGDWLYFAFPGTVQPPPKNIRFLFAKRAGNLLDILELEPSQTPCTAN